MFNGGRKSWIAGVAVIAVLLAIATTTYQTKLRHSREDVLKANLAVMRSVIDQYSHDKHRAPKSLQDLVDEGYFRELPIDPFTNSNSTWEPVIKQGVVDIHSGSSAYRGL